MSPALWNRTNEVVSAQVGELREENGRMKTLLALHGVTPIEECTELHMLAAEVSSLQHGATVLNVEIASLRSDVSGLKVWRTTRVRTDMKARGYDFSDVGFHTARHTTLTTAMKTHPIAKMSRLAGHASVQITIDRYGHIAADDLVDMVDDIAA